MRGLWVAKMAVLLGCLCLVGCGQDEEPQPYPGDLIDGAWRGTFVSENTGQEKSFDAILCFGFDPDILPPYYYDLMGYDPIGRTPRITNVERVLVGVSGVFRIRSNDQVDTLGANGSFSFESGLSLELSAAPSHFENYRLRNGMIDDDMVQGSYKEFRLEDGQRAQIDAGTWKGTRTERMKPAAQSTAHNPTQGG